MEPNYYNYNVQSGAPNFDGYGGFVQSTGLGVETTMFSGAGQQHQQPLESYHTGIANSGDNGNTGASGGHQGGRGTFGRFRGSRGGYRNQAARGGQPYTPHAPKPPPPPALYCEVCRVSCAGAQPFAEHVAGKNHRKKEALLNVQMSAPSGGGSVGNSSVRGAASLLSNGYCELCGVSCSSAGTFAAHIAGAKHLKTVALHKSLGKPIPDVIVPQSPGWGAPTATTTPAARPPAATAIRFVTGEEESNVAASPQQPFLKDSPLATPESLGEIVGEEYIEEMANDRGVVVSYSCKLCNCSFTDLAAKRAHLRGRRHRTEYKKQVDPSTRIEQKKSNSSRTSRVKNDRQRRIQDKEEYWQSHQEGRTMQRYDFPQDAGMGGDMRWGAEPHPLFAPPQQMMYTRSWTLDNKYMNMKHKEIVPTPEEMFAIQELVTSAERSLKLASDAILAEDHAATVGAEGTVVGEGGDEIGNGSKETGNGSKEQEATKDNETEGVSKENVTGHGESVVRRPPAVVRVIKGVMRAGILSGGLLLTGDRDVQVIIMCCMRPTKALLTRLVDHLTTQLALASPETTHGITSNVDEAVIIVTRLTEPKVSCSLFLTSTVVKDDNFDAEDGAAPTEGTNGGGDSDDQLSKEKCLWALSALRRSKWFQVRVNCLKWGVLCIRILRNIRQRLPTWEPMSDWALSLLVEKCICYAGLDIGPAEAMRTVFECIASGILLPGGQGLLDPCEKEPTDVCESLTVQEREDITASAQMALRMIVYRQIYKVLDVTKLPPRPPTDHHYQRGHNGNKRRIKDFAVTGGEEKKLKEDTDFQVTGNPEQTAAIEDETDVKVEIPTFVE